MEFIQQHVCDCRNSLGLPCIHRRAPMSTAFTALEALSLPYTVYYSFTDNNYIPLCVR